MVLGLIVALASCKADPASTDLEFGKATFECEEGSEDGSISVYLMHSPYKYPVVVDLDVEMVGGKDNNGKELNLDDVLEFIVTDQTYTVTKTGDRTAKIENIEVTYSGYNKKVYFKSFGNDYLQGETITINFTITRVDGSEIGSIKTATLTIVDDEKAPLVKVGYYDTRYTSPAEATSPQKGAFYMRLQKVGKYEYVASELFGLSRPRLLGIYDPEQNTITFDGTDYDHILWNVKEPINAFQNDTIWAASYNKEGVVTEVIKMRGAGSNGTEPIVMTTESIEENSRGVILSIDSACGFDIYSYNAANGSVGTKVGTYDAMERSQEMTFSDTNYPTETRAAVGFSLPVPFGGWSINK